MIWYLVKKHDCSLMLVRSSYAVATVKLRSVITLKYSSVIMNLTAIQPRICTHIDLRTQLMAIFYMAGLHSETCSVLHLISK